MASHSSPDSIASLKASVREILLVAVRKLLPGSLSRRPQERALVTGPSVYLTAEDIDGTTTKQSKYVIVEIIVATVRIE
eukprot:gene35200-45588_t